MNDINMLYNINSKIFEYLMLRNNNDENIT